MAALTSEAAFDGTWKGGAHNHSRSLTHMLTSYNDIFD
jgi:hypothetical protein